MLYIITQHQLTDAGQQEDFAQLKTFCELTILRKVHNAISITVTNSTLMKKT